MIYSRAAHESWEDIFWGHEAGLIEIGCIPYTPWLPSPFVIEANEQEGSTP